MCTFLQTLLTDRLDPLPYALALAAGVLVAGALIVAVLTCAEI